MNSQLLAIAIYGSPLVLIWAYYLLRRSKQHRDSLTIFEESKEAGLLTPASLHPVIDAATCIGCESCVTACPEQPTHRVLGMVRRKATLVSPTDCIGHGACKTACPVDAITLVFGTAERGVDIPNVKPNFETNVPGVFIAGELGGMGLISNAIEQGRQAVDSIAKLAKTSSHDCLDLLIVGAGPAGIAASLAAEERRLNYLTIEQDSLGGTVAHFPRQKLVMTSPAVLPLVGKIKFRETSKEHLLDFWTGVARDKRLRIHFGERFETIQRSSKHWQVQTTKGSYAVGALLLSIGRRGTPRKLGVPGEALDKVTYNLIDPAQYRGQRVLIVGGGDSALESALAISQEPGTTTTLSYRSSAFTRAKKRNREKLAAAEQHGEISVLLESTVESIDADQVVIASSGKTLTIGNDAVIINAGGILPTGMLQGLGIEFETKFGTA